MIPSEYDHVLVYNATMIVGQGSERSKRIEMFGIVESRVKSISDFHLTIAPPDDIGNPAGDGTTISLGPYVGI